MNVLILPHLLLLLLEIVFPDSNLESEGAEEVGDGELGGDDNGGDSPMSERRGEGANTLEKHEYRVWLTGSVRTSGGMQPIRGSICS